MTPLTRPGPDQPERAALGRARWAITVRLTLLTTVIVLLIECLIYFVMAHERAADTRHDLLWAVDHGSLITPPGCTWLVIERDRVVTSATSLPDGFPITPSLDSVRAGAPALFEEVHRGGNGYTVLTRRRGGEVVQVIYDERFHTAERENLLSAFAVALVITALATAAVVATASRFLSDRATAPLRDALARQRRFVADASHELRAPLAQLHTRAQLLARKADALNCPESLAADLRRLVNGTRQLGDVVDDILRSVRMGEPSPSKVVDMAALADEVVAAEDIRASQSGLAVRVRRESGECLVRGAESALRRVVIALVDNAIGHTPSGGVVEVVLDTPNAGTVRLSVRDSGLGFEQADPRRLFERFSHGSAGRGQRFGLGLALVREIVESHRGRVTAEGSPGAGAVFTVELPAVTDKTLLPRKVSSTVSAIFRLRSG